MGIEGQPLTSWTGRRITPGDGYLEALVKPSKYDAYLRFGQLTVR